MRIGRRRPTNRPAEESFGADLKVRTALREAEDMAWRAVTIGFCMALGVVILYSMHLNNKVSSRRTGNEKDYR